MEPVMTENFLDLLVPLYFFKIIMSEKTKNKFSIFIFTTITFFIVILDYYVKSAIEAKPLYYNYPLVGKFISIFHLRNFGGAFSILQNQKLFFILMGILIPILLFIFMRKYIFSDMKYLISCAFISGGAFGNLLDRFLYGYVVDYIAVGTFPVFNISDSFITVGAVCLGLLLLFEKDKKEDNKKENIEDLKCTE